MSNNTITGLMPTVYAALDTVVREMVGYIPAVSKDPSTAQAALNQTITFPVVASGTVGDVTAAAYGPDPAGQTIAPVTLSISKSRSVALQVNAEEALGMGSSTTETFLRNGFAQAMRLLVNEIEVDLHTAAYKASSRAYGSAGTAPFATASDYSDFAFTRQILEDNGAPTSDLHLVLGSAAAANIRAKQSTLFKANESGSTALLRTGDLGQVEGFNLHVSNAPSKLTKGTGTLYVTSGSTAVGVSDIALVTGTNTVLAGDVVTFAADANNKYVVNTGVAAAGTISLGKPGARVIIATANAMTIGNGYTPNMAFDRSALYLATRLPASPAGGDEATDVVVVQDPISGLAFEIRMYRQYRRVAYEVAIAWGVKAVKSEFIATLMG